MKEVEPPLKRPGGQTIGIGHFGRRTNIIRSHHSFAFLASVRYWCIWFQGALLQHPQQLHPQTLDQVPLQRHSLPMFWLFFFKHVVSFIRFLCQLFVGLQVASFRMLWDALDFDDSWPSGPGSCSPLGLVATTGQGTEGQFVMFCHRAIFLFIWLSFEDA